MKEESKNTASEETEEAREMRLQKERMLNLVKEKKEPKKRVSKVAREKFEEAERKLREAAENQKRMAEEAMKAIEDDKKLAEETSEKIKAIAEENGFFCGVILNRDQLMQILRLHMDSGENIEIPFALYFLDDIKH